MKKYIVYFKQIGVIECLLLLINFIFYRLKYIQKEDIEGWFLVKRIWVWFLFTPLFLPVYLLIHILAGSIAYFKEIFNYYHSWIERDNKPMNLPEKIIYRRQLWS